MKEFQFKNITQTLLNELDSCDTAEEIVEFLKTKDYEISLENAQKLYNFANDIVELSDEETAKTSGGCDNSKNNCPE